jgi:hypothetical protein
MKIETVLLAGQHVQPWGILVDGLLDCDIPRCNYEKAAAFFALMKYPGSTVHTTKSPEHYSNL